MARSISWRSFKHTHQNKLNHIAGYEERFVDLVLTQIPNLSPLDVIPQFHFTDKHGGNRYIDFVIYNQAKGYLLAIELDGYAKMVGNGNDYERFQDFLDRQNDVIKLFGKLLRFSNKQFLNNPNQVIQEIQSSMYATDNELFWFDFKLTQILNNPNIPHKFIYYDFTDLILKSIYQNTVCQFSITDCITIQHSPKHYIRITLTSTSTEIYCNLTNRKFSKNESFYKDKDTFYSIITTIIDTTKELTQTTHYPIIPLPNKVLNTKEWEDYYEIDSNHFLIKKVCSKFKDFNLAMLHIHVWSDDSIAFVYTYPFSYKQINYPFYAYIMITQEGKELGIPFPNQSITGSWVYTEEDITHNPKQVIHLVNEAIQNHEQTSINQYKQDNPSLLRTVSTGIAKLFGLAKEGVSQLDNAMDRVQEIVTEELIQTLEKNLIHENNPERIQKIKTIIKLKNQYLHTTDPTTKKHLQQQAKDLLHHVLYNKEQVIQNKQVTSEPVMGNISVKKQEEEPYTVQNEETSWLSDIPNKLCDSLVHIAIGVIGVLLFIGLILVMTVISQVLIQTNY